MTETVTYPSAESPAPAGVSLPRPEGWDVLAVPAALLALGKRGHAPTEFQPNVVVTSQRGIGSTLEEAAAATVAALESLAGWEEAGQEFRDTFGGRPGFRIEGAFSHPQAGTLYQAAVIAVVERGPFTDVVQAVGSCSAGQVNQCLPVIRAILQDATVTD